MSDDGIEEARQAIFTAMNERLLTMSDRKYGIEEARRDLRRLCALYRRDDDMEVAARLLADIERLNAENVKLHRIRYEAERMNDNGAYLSVNLVEALADYEQAAREAVSDE